MYPFKMTIDAIQKINKEEIKEFYCDVLEMWDNFINSRAMCIASGCFLMAAGMIGWLYFITPPPLGYKLAIICSIPLGLSVLCSIFCKSIADFCEFSDYEIRKFTFGLEDLPRDEQLYLWEETKYYRYVQLRTSRFVSIGYNVTHDAPQDCQNGDVSATEPDLSFLSSEEGG